MSSKGKLIHFATRKLTPWCIFMIISLYYCDYYFTVSFIANHKSLNFDSNILQSDFSDYEGRVNLRALLL